MRSAIIGLVTTSMYLSTRGRTAAFNLANKRALVTGSSGGIGAAIAKTLAENGARVLVHYNTRREGALATKRDILAGGGKCDGVIQCDFRSPSAIDDMFRLVDDVWDGGIDVLVNNAGVVTKLAVEDDDANLTAWHETMAVNLHAPLQLSKLAHARMKGQKSSGGGVIINVSSIHGSVSVEWMTAYAASKAALDRVTAGLSSEWARDGVRVSAVAPGIVPVERTEKILSQPEVQDLWLPHLPVGRMGTVQDIADAVLYLAQSEWTSGSILTIDGGMTARSNMPIRPKPPVATEKDLSKGIEDVCTEARYEK